METPKVGLKIGLVLDDGLDEPDGVQQYILSIGEWLKMQGHTVHYLVGQTKRLDIGGTHSLSRNISVSSNGNSMSIPLPTSRHKLKAHLKREKYDVLHVQVPYSPFMGGQLVNMVDKSTAVVGTFHILPNSTLISFGTRLLGLWSWRSLRRFDKMLSVSPAAKAFAKKTFGVDSDILPNVVDYERFSSGGRLTKYQDGVLNILFLGRLVPRKGCLTLLQAITELKSDRAYLPKFRVIVCGRGPLQTSLAKYVFENAMEDLVEFAGFVKEEDKPNYYASADIAVFPSSGGESFGIVLLEAMAGGAATLAGDNPGYRSVLADYPDQLFKATDSHELALLIKRYLTDASLRQATAKQGQDFAKNFDIPIVASQLVEIYNQALQKRRG